MADVSFGEWLKRQRNAKGLTQEQLARQVGCAAITLRKIEAEERRPSEQIATRLADIFNIPSKDRENFLRYARGAWASASIEIETDMPWRAKPRQPRSNLPGTVTSLIGREKELADIREYILREDIRLITLIGPPGIGKTRLSIESARGALADFPDGVFFVPLAPLEEPSLIAQSIAQSLGYVGATNLPAEKQLNEGIRDQQMLLVLDNCEHLIESVAVLASGLLSACSRLTILATSREALRIPGEWLYPLPTFNVPAEEVTLDIKSATNFPALTLFAERARAVRPDFVLDAENVKTVSAICARLDGLPLAIELIAARIRSMTPQTLLEKLDEQFILSADGMRAVPVRQKTLGNAIAWSYNLLPKEEQRLFACLSVFSGCFTQNMAEAMLADSFPEKLLPYLLISLSDQSLLQSSPAETSEMRYTMLATIREFARDRLRTTGEEARIRNDHLKYFLELTKGANQELRGPNHLVWLRRLGAVIDNLRTALEWGIESGQAESALRLVRNLDWFWFVRSDHTEARQWHQRVLDMLDTHLYPEARAEALYQLAHHTWLQVGADAARPLAEESLSIARIRADRHNTARALSILGLILADEKNFAEAQAVLEESKALYEEVHDEWGVAHTYTCLGEIPHLQEDRVSALALRESALKLFRKLGDGYFESGILSYVGGTQVRLGNLAEGVKALRESLLLTQQLGGKLRIAITLWDFARVSQIKGELLRAVRLYWATKNLYDDIGVWQTSEETKFENDLAPCRAGLSESAFAEAMEQGRAMTMEQAIEYALEEDL